MLSLELLNQQKANIQNNIADYNEQFLGRFIKTTREDTGIGGSYAPKLEEMAEALEERRRRANEGFDNIITSFNEIGKTVEGFVEADLTGKLQSKVDDSTVGEMEIMVERQTDAAPGL